MAKGIICVSPCAVAEPCLLYSCIADVVSRFDDMVTAMSTGPTAAAPKVRLYFVPTTPNVVCWDAPNVQYVLTKLMMSAVQHVVSLHDAGNVTIVVSYDGRNQITIEVGAGVKSFDLVDI